MIISKYLFFYIVLYFCCISIFFPFFLGENIGDVFVTTNDEYRYYLATNNMINDYSRFGWIYMFKNYYEYSNSLHFGYYFYLTFIRILIDDSLALWYSLQVAILFLSYFFFSKFIDLEFELGENRKYLLCFLMLLYLPMVYLTFSLMRDVTIFLLISLCLFLYKKNNYLLLTIFLLILLTYRMNASLGVLIYIVLDLIIRKNIKIKNIFYILIPMLIIALFLFNNYFLIFMERLSSLSISKFLFESFRFVFSPIPWQIDAYIPFYLHVWYYISFFSCVLLIFFLASLCLRRGGFNSVFSIPLFAMVLFNIFAYSTEAGVGFRQMAVFSPFFFIPIYIYIFNTFRKI